MVVWVDDVVSFFFVCVNLLLVLIGKIVKI